MARIDGRISQLVQLWYVSVASVTLQAIFSLWLVRREFRRRLPRARSDGGEHMTLKTFINVAGWSAALLILSAYGLLSFGKIQAGSSHLPGA